MTLHQFIRQHRQLIDDVIKASGGRHFNDDERELWVLNDEGLYNWAREEGVDV